MQSSTLRCVTSQHNACSTSAPVSSCKFSSGASPAWTLTNAVQTQRSYRHSQSHEQRRGRNSRIQIAPAPPSLDTGSPTPMAVSLQRYDTFKLWLWLELYEPATGDQKDLLEAVLTSWFTVGRLGGYNAQNLQVHYKGASGKTNYTYDDAQCDTSMEAMFHDMGSPEYRGKTCRCWVNLGTADELAIDILINALNTFSQENMGIKKLTVGGDNKVWPVPADDRTAKDDPLLAGMDMGEY